MKIVLSYLRPDLMGAYSVPISAQVTLALIAQWTSSARDLCRAKEVSARTPTNTAVTTLTF